MRNSPWVYAAIVAALALGACSRRETRVEEGNRLKILHVGNGGEVADLDPQTAIAAVDGDVISALFEPLIQLDPVDLHPMAGAAASWEISPDGRPTRAGCGMRCCGL